MEESEKMRALKKAYAEIILNTAKEAAARVMASERKVHQFQYDLSSTKDEALRLLLRLKQSMDVKIHEAEMKSLNQQRRIDELEAQLQEAEDIVSNLRAELNEAHTKLEEMERKQVNNTPKISENFHCEEITKQTENGVPEGVLASQINSSKLMNGHFFANSSVEEFGFSGDPVVPSIIRSKKPELYRNGCTQRIRAYEGNLVNGHFPVSGDFDDVKYEKCVREEKESEVIYVDNNNNNNNSNRPYELNSFRKKRKRAARYKRSDAFGLKSNTPLAKQTQTSLLDSQGIPENGEIDVKGTQSNPPIVLSGCVETTLGDSIEACLVATNENTEVASSLVMIREENGSRDCLDVPNSKVDIEIKDSSILNLDRKHQEIGDGFCSLHRNDRVLKYTFQRKRKKETLIVDNGKLNEENPSERKMVNKENGNLEVPNSCNVAESSRDSRRMAQVARQLLTLSDKKWWN